MELPEVRERVLEAAGRLFYRDGIQAVGMDAIRAASGISLKRLYQCFPSKESLVTHYLAERDTNWRDALVRFVDAADTDSPRTLAVFDFLAAWFTTDDFRGCSFINAFGELGARSEPVAHAVYAHKRTLLLHLQDFLRRDGITEPARLAEQLLLLVDGAIVCAATGGNPNAADDARSVAAGLLAGSPRSSGTPLPEARATPAPAPHEPPSPTPTEAAPPPPLLDTPPRS
ncbi:TetR/AcrR family transcriptional regulator [Nocardiopsis rhodophaea]|uniref:TetR/AcrR family transcriptional regulator n=1 Tax=Nocardiopsis rhodophaea TaxID=280238 RepID=A0ABN2SRW8_9ACTN